MQVEWLLRRFEELTVYQLYAVLQLRTEVFVVEQNCVFQDMDDKDQESFHLLGYAGEKLVAYTRLVPGGVIYDYPSIGRVVTSPSFRGRGAGRDLMQESIRKCIQLFGDKPIKIGAQFYLRSFYNSLGFEQISEIYLEDGIEHIYMLRKATGY
jgi:ElaA protein